MDDVSIALAVIFFYPMGENWNCIKSFN